MKNLTENVKKQLDSIKKEYGCKTYSEAVNILLLIYEEKKKKSSE